MMNKDTSWNKVASWYDRYVTELSDYHKDIIIPGALRLLGPLKDKKILDVGCGQGIFCREAAKAGALSFGVDSSKKLIEIARKRSADLNIHYRVADASKMADFQNGTFDGVSCILAVQNMENLPAVIKEMSRVLKNGGRMLLVMNHPCFRIPRQSGWGFDEKRKLQYRRVDRYMSEMKIPIQMHPGQAPGVHTWSFHRPMSAFFDALISNGLLISGLEEWVSHRKSLPGGRSRTENASREEIPLFMAIAGAKT